MYAFRPGRNVCFDRGRVKTPRDFRFRPFQTKSAGLCVYNRLILLKANFAVDVGNTGFAMEPAFSHSLDP
jgi:hypothetical protein